MVRDAAWLLHNDCIEASEVIKDELVKVGAVGKLVALLQSEDERMSPPMQLALSGTSYLSTQPTVPGARRASGACTREAPCGR